MLQNAGQMLEDAGRPKSFETNESYTSPKVACDRIDCCIALPGDGCAFTTSLKKLEQVTAEICANATQQQSVPDNITPGMWVIIQMSTTQEAYVYM